MKKILLVILAVFFMFSCSSWNNNLDVINPDADYIYFYWKTCPHCIEVNKYFTENDIMNKYKIEKREVWNNAENSEIFKQKIEELWIASESVWVPFVLKKIDNSYVIWDEPIKKLFDANVPLLSN